MIWKGNREIERKIKNEKPTYSDYVHKLHLILGVSEYDVFKIAARENGWSEYLVDEHFAQYLRDGVIPKYVKDFIDEGRQYIDEAKVKTWVY